VDKSGGGYIGTTPPINNKIEHLLLVVHLK